MLNHELYIRECLKLAETIADNEVPVAALLVDISTGEILCKGVNTREKDASVLAHAEINVIKDASEKLKTWNLSGYALYVSLEPCAMCAGAILQSHLSQVIFAAYDSKTGAFGSRYNLINNNIKIYGGILEQESIQLLQKFFKDKRH